jgi:hypothetical protein
LTNAGDAQRKPEKEYVPLKQTLQLYYAAKNAPSPRGKNSEMIRRSMLSSGRKNRESRLLSSPSEFADQWQFDEFLPQNPRQMTAHTQMHSTQKANLHATQNRAKTNISPHGCVPPKHVPASTRNKHIPLWQMPASEAASAIKKPAGFTMAFFPSALPSRKNSVFRTRNDNHLAEKRLSASNSQRQIAMRPDQLMRDIKAATAGLTSKPYMNPRHDQQPMGGFVRTMASTKMKQHL